MMNTAIAQLDAEVEIMDEHVEAVLDYLLERQIAERPEYDWAYRPPVRLDPREPFLPEEACE